MSVVPTLERLEAIAAEVEAGDLTTETRELRQRIDRQRFYVACLGQFKRGKSTLLNALVGAPVLPTGVVPVTAVPTVIGWGPLSARVRLDRGDWRPVEPGEIAHYVSEEQNPDNRKGVTAVEVLTPSPLLASGLCLVDTPGIGSVFEAGALATRAFLPQIDAAIVVLGADPPISGEELRLIAAVHEQIPDLIFVLNKADRITPAERAEAREFTERTLARRLKRPPGAVYEVCALNALLGGGDTGDWDRFVEALGRLSGASASLIRAAAGRGAARIGKELRRLLEEERQALLRPVEASERRIATLRTLSAAVDRSLAELGPLLTAEEQRLARMFAERRERFRADSIPAALAELTARLSSGAVHGGRMRREQGLKIASELAEARLRPWLGESENAAEEAYREAGHRFEQLAQGLLSHLREADDDRSSDPVDLPPEPAGLDRPRGFFFTHLMARHYAMSPLTWFGDRLLPTRVRQRRIESAAERYLVDLLGVNAARVEGDLAERVRESRRVLAGRVRGALERAARSAEDALRRTRTTRARGQQAVSARLALVEGRLTELDALTGSGMVGVRTKVVPD